jgi:oligopeptide/dipeptide ABC transporter ATP-binding protein
VTSLLELRDVAVSYHRQGQPPVRAVAGVDLSIDAGEIIGLVGETGCGKSSLARAMVGLVAPESGEVIFDGARVDPIGRRSRVQAQRQLQMIFQDPSSSLNPRRKVGAQIQSAVLLASPERADPKKQAAALLEQVGLPSTAAERYPHEFSGGQRQRIAIARALAARPRLIVADEPIAALDASAQAQIANLLVSLSRDLGLSLVFISHDLSIVRQVADVTAVMYLGKIVERAPTGLLWDSPAHPYTRALTAAVPRVGEPGQLPAELPGDVPDPARPPTGCRFHPRCPIAIEKCRAQEPIAVIAPRREAYCWRSELVTANVPSGRSDQSDQSASTSS